MNFYEGLFLLDPADAAGNWNDLKGYITGMLERFGCEILYSERWSDKKLAYPIKGRQKGTYFLVYFKAAGDTLTALKEEIRIAERILRVLFLRKDKALDEIEKLKEHKMKQAAASADDDEGYALSDDAGDETDDTDHGTDDVKTARAGPDKTYKGDTDDTEDTEDTDDDDDDDSIGDDYDDDTTDDDTGNAEDAEAPDGDDRGAGKPKHKSPDAADTPDDASADEKDA